MFDKNQAVTSVDPQVVADAGVVADVDVDVVGVVHLQHRWLLQPVVRLPEKHPF